MTPKPQEIQEIYQDYVSKRYTALRERQQAHEDLFNQKADLHLSGKDFQNPIWPPTAMRIVEAPADNIARDYISVNVPPTLKAPTGLTTKGAETQADLKGRWLQMVVDLWRRSEPYFLRELIKNLSYRGEGYLCIDLDENYIRSKDPDSLGSFPIRLSAPDSRGIYASLDMEDCQPADVFREKVVTAAHIRRQALAWNKGKNYPLGIGHLKDTDLVYLVEWWTREWRGYFSAGWFDHSIFGVVPLNDEDVLPNPLGLVPYLRGFSGRGIWPQDGNVASIAVGILTGIERILIRDARNITKIDTVTSKFVLPILSPKLAPGYTLSKEEADVSAGSVLPRRDDMVQEWLYLLPPPIPTDLLQERQDIDQALSDYLPPVLRGVATPGEPASSMSARYSWASDLWEPMRISARRLVARACEVTLQILDRVIQEPMEIGGLKLGPGNINGDYRVEVDIRPGNPEKLTQDILLGVQLWQAKCVPQKVIVEKYFHEPDATQFLTDLDTDAMWERLKSNPQLLQGFDQLLMERIGLKQEIERMQAQAREAQAFSAPTGEQTRELPEEGEGLAPVPSTGEQMPGAGGSPSKGVPGQSWARGLMTEGQRRMRQMANAVRMGR